MTAQYDPNSNLVPQPAKRKHWGRRIVLTATALTVGGIIIGAASGGQHAKPVYPKVTHSAPAAHASSDAKQQCLSAGNTWSGDGSGKCLPSQPAPPAPATTPAISAAHQQALDSATSYLSDGQGFSRDGLISQMQFDKFSLADATWAVDHTGTDWDAQAATSAKSYVSDGQGFSRQGLIDQLQFDKFTYEQASHGATAAGL